MTSCIIRLTMQKGKMCQKLESKQTKAMSQENNISFPFQDGLQINQWCTTDAQCKLFSIEN